MPDYSKQIAEMEAILNSGITSTESAGVRTTIDLDALRRRLNELRAQDDSRRCKRRPLIAFRTGNIAP